MSIHGSKLKTPRSIEKVDGGGFVELPTRLCRKKALSVINIKNNHMPYSDPGLLPTYQQRS